MPRPKIGRARIANNRRGPQRVANHVKMITRQAVQNQLDAKEVGHVLSNSDDSDDLVVARKGLRNYEGIPRKEIYGSGGLGPGDKPMAHKRMQAAANRKASTSISGSQKSPTATSQIKNATSSPLTTVPTSTPLKSILKSPSTSLQSQSVTQNNSMSVRPQSTPIDRSLLAGLKPRSRQPSLLAGLKQNIPNFDDSDLAVTGLDEFEDIVPNDESTPLNTAKSGTSAKISSLSSQAPSSVIGRKRKITPVETPLEPTPGRPTQSAYLDDQVDNESSITGRSEPRLPSMGTRNARDVDQENSINAPPASSSSPIQSPRRTNDVPLSQSQRSHSPVIKQKVTRRKAKAEPSKMTTEALQAMLPSRRGQEKTTTLSKEGEWDIPSGSAQGMQMDGMDEAGDESSYLPTKRQRQSVPRKETASKAGGKKGQGGRKPVAGPKRKAVDNKKGRSPIKATPLKDVSTRAAAKISVQQGTKKVTYSSRRLDISEGDKENQPFDTSDAFALPENLELDGSRNESSSEIMSKSSQREKLRWAMIDAYEMDFEDMSPDALGNSSPGR